jgi:ABC-type multidrug transport system ATPase subunit
MAGPLLHARGITCRYGGVEALAPTDLRIAAGERIALTGPNGAGKTTLLSVLAGVRRPDAGTVEWEPGARDHVGWVPQRPALYPRLTVRENLRLFAGLEGADDPGGAADALIARADLGQFAGRRASALSTGTLQRLNLAIALAGAPSLLLLDEPTGTLSPDQRVRLWAWMADLVRQDDMALVFSTQSMDEAARNADRVLVLDGGRLRHDGPAGQLDDAGFMAMLGDAP